MKTQGTNVFEQRLCLVRAALFAMEDLLVDINERQEPELARIVLASVLIIRIAEERIRDNGQ